MMQAPADEIVRWQGVRMDARDCTRERALPMARGEFLYLPFVAIGGVRLAGQEQQLSEGRLTEAAQGRIFMIDIKGDDGYLKGDEGKSGGGFLDVEIEAAKLSGVKALEVAK